MEAEQKELYYYVKDHFEEELKRISPSCVSPIIATRQVVGMAIEKYIKNYCGSEEVAYEIFSQEDFQAVSHKIRDEIMEGSL